MNEEIIKRALEIEGLINEDELRILSVLAQKYIHSNGNVLEVGCYKGRCSLVLASIVSDYSKTGNLFILDTFDTGGGERRPEYKHHSVDMLIDNLGVYSNVCRIFNGEFVDFDITNELMSYNYDFVFIDGDHRYSKALLEHEMLKHQTGRIIGHDLNNNDVKRAVTAFLAHNNATLIDYGTTQGLYELIMK